MSITGVRCSLSTLDTLVRYRPGLLTYTDEEMKYPIQTVDLEADVVLPVSTSITTKPYNIFLFLFNAVTERWDNITQSVDISVAIPEGETTYTVYILSGAPLSSVDLLILY